MDGRCNKLHTILFNKRSLCKRLKFERDSLKILDKIEMQLLKLERRLCNF